VVRTSESEMEVERESDERWIRQVSKRMSSACDRMDNSLGLDIARLLVVSTSWKCMPTGRLLVVHAFKDLLSSFVVSLCVTIL
jgi:hypothetical protein